MEIKRRCPKGFNEFVDEAFDALLDLIKLDMNGFFQVVFQGENLNQGRIQIDRFKECIRRKSGLSPLDAEILAEQFKDAKNQSV